MCRHHEASLGSCFVSRPRRYFLKSDLSRERAGTTICGCALWQGRCAPFLPIRCAMVAVVVVGMYLSPVPRVCTCLPCLLVFATLVVVGSCRF